MRIHFIRNATLLIESGDRRILVDPMLGPRGSLPPMAIFRHRARCNPLVDLPPGAADTAATATVALITHLHPDHLDGHGAALLATKQIPTHGNPPDLAKLRKRGICAQPIPPDTDHAFLGGTIRSIPTEHGYGFLLKLMGPGVGYLIRLPGEPSLYLTGDTVLTPAARRVLADERPDVCVFPAGTAQLDFGRPILMPIAEMVEFVRLSRGVAVANHLESLNHCPTTRDALRAAMTDAGLASRLKIPADGETLEFKAD